MTRLSVASRIPRIDEFIGRTSFGGYRADGHAFCA